MSIKAFPNQKPWIDGSIRTKLKARTIAFNQGKVTGNMTEYKECSYSLRKAIKQAIRETEKQLLPQGHQTVKQPSLTLSGCCQHTDSTPATLIMEIDVKNVSLATFNNAT